jgi:MoxR-like ATPase
MERAGTNPEQRSPEAAAPRPPEYVPVRETETSVAYLGVELPKAENGDSVFVPNRESYKDYINDQFALELQQKIATSFLQGDPVMIEGGTSLGKTTTAKKMCAELGWEVHYANLNGATDVEDLMGRYIPNPNRTSSDDPEYIFADGKVTSGLRQEEGKIKVIILDEINAASPSVLIRLHEVLDSLERNGDVVLAEDASEAVRVNKSTTKVIAFMNPPGKGYLEKNPMDPAQLRRWVYQKEVSELPKSTFDFGTDALFGFKDGAEAIPESSYVFSNEGALSPEQLKDIPGIEEMLRLYKEFHQAAKALITQRRIGADQPQPFTFDDRMEPRRVRDFILNFYRGDLNETFQAALRYYYVNKLENKDERQKLEELVVNVHYTPRLAASQRRPLDPTATPAPATAAPRAPGAPEMLLSGTIIEQMDKGREIFGKNFLGPEQIEKAFGFKVRSESIPEIPFSEAELREAKRLNQFLVLRVDKTPTGETLNMKQMLGALEAKVKAEGKGKVLYDTGWYSGEDFFTKEAPRTGWALVGGELLEVTKGKNYLQQTEELAKYLETEVFKGRAIPPAFQEAIEELKKSKKDIERLIRDDWEEAAKRLADLKLNKLTRQTMPELMYDVMMQFRNNDNRLLESPYAWTVSRSSDGGLVDGGNFDSGGMFVNWWRPGDGVGRLGVLFSRRS